MWNSNSVTENSKMVLFFDARRGVNVYVNVRNVSAVRGYVGNESRSVIYVVGVDSPFLVDGSLSEVCAKLGFTEKDVV